MAPPAATFGRAPAAAAGPLLSNASRYATLQRSFNDRLREWHWQRGDGTHYQVWKPPGVVFCKLKRDHHLHGRYGPRWSDWGFDEEGPALRLVLGALSGRWAVWLAQHRPEERWVVVDGDDGRLFQAFARAMNAFGLDAVDPEKAFPNLRLVQANERLAPSFFAAGALRSVHVHLPHGARASRPPRAALLSGEFAADVSAALGPQGELHLVSDDEAILSEASGELTRSRRFAPCLAFPFHEEGVPSSYPAAPLLRRDISGVLGARPGGLGAAEPAEAAEAAEATGRRLFHARWERKPELLPNFRFRGR